MALLYVGTNQKRGRTLAIYFDHAQLEDAALHIVGSELLFATTVASD